LGPNVWLIHVAVILEWVLFYKNYNGTFTSPFPVPVIILWVFIGTIFFSILGYLIYTDVQRAKERRKKLRVKPSDSSVDENSSD